MRNIVIGRRPWTSKRLARRRMTRRTVLASTSADPLKSYDLTWLTVLGGRRLSAAACFDAREQHRPEPKFRRQSSQTQLHELRIACVWDDLLGTKNNLKTVVKAARKLQAAGAALAAKSDEKDWITESFMESQQTVYASPIAAGNGPFTLTAPYKKNAGKLAK